MRLDRLILENYRGFARLDVTLADGPCTLFVGRNGSGKSSIVEAFGSLLASAVIRASGFETPFSAFLKSDLRKGAPGLVIQACFASTKLFSVVRPAR